LLIDEEKDVIMGADLISNEADDLINHFATAIQFKLPTKKLKQMIEKTLEHKKISPRSDLHTGRLNKKLLKLLTDDNPRLFYKKNQPSAQIDAAFC
ncbi:hypothetical protein R0K17_21965, partial [Planococcus sp. SIMBA_143]